MEKLLIPVAVLVALISLVSIGIAFSQETKTIKGEIIDVSCYVAAGAMGADHKNCATACIKAGEPAGILEEKTGNVYIVITGDHSTNPGKKVLSNVANMVEAKGTVSEKGGIRTIDITEIKKVAVK